MLSEEFKIWPKSRSVTLNERPTQVRYQLNLGFCLRLKRDAPAVFVDFNFGKASDQDPKIRGKFQAMLAPPAKMAVWEDEIPRRAMSGDGYNLVYYIPGRVTRSVLTFQLRILICSQIVRKR